MENIKILVTSDLHGNLPTIDKEFDLLLICGDICPAHDHYYNFQREWLMNEFADWVNNIPLSRDPIRESFCKVVMIGGNHDYLLERISKSDITEFYKKTNNRIIILKNEEYNWEYLDDNGINSLKIFGTPYCKIFGNWAFMVSNSTLKEKFSKIPENCDILLTHDAPDINDLGLIQEGWAKGINAGNVILAEAIKEKKPHFVFCGHIHSGNHKFENIDGIWMTNVSYIDERYIPSYPILEFEINRNTKEKGL